MHQYSRVRIWVGLVSEIIGGEIAEAVTTAASMEESLRRYTRFGVSYSSDAGMMLYGGLPVRELYDEKTGILVTLRLGSGFAGSLVPGDAIDLRTVYDGDTLVGLRKATKAEFDARTRQRENALATTYSITTENTEPSSVTTNGFTNLDFPSDGSGKTIAEFYEVYTEFSVKFDTKSVNGGLGNIYYQGKMVKQFTDLTPDGGVFSCDSSDGGTISLRTVYDKKGKLIGVEVADA